MEVSRLDNEMDFNLGAFRDAKLVLLMLMFIEDDKHERLVEGVIRVTYVREHAKSYLALMEIGILYNHIALVI